jgi:hypothetical protein
MVWNDVRDYMNAKKVKKLRQLTRVMQEKGVVDKEWKVGGHVDTTSVLKPECGQAVYKAMKKRAS